MKDEVSEEDLKEKEWMEEMWINKQAITTDDKQ